MIDRELRINVYPKSGEPQRHVFRARWRADSGRRTHAELREPVGRGVSPADADAADAVVGRITVTWRNVSDGLGSVLGGLLNRSVPRPLRQMWDPDPALDLSEIEIDILQSVTGKPLSRSTRKAGITAAYWKVNADPADWWTSVVVYRDGVPILGEFGGT